VSATHKRELARVDGKPEKRLFLSIISDYDLKIGLCELVDNALDLWMSNGKKSGLTIDVDLDVGRQLISVSDNSGGVREQELRFLIAPGASRSHPDHDLIGIFGVGGKRAGVALGELVEIRTRYKKEKSLEVDINKEWLASDDWELPVYEIPDITPSTTTVEISKVRQSFDSKDVDRLRTEFGEIYSWFIKEGCDLRLNGASVKPIEFKKWAYPPSYGPREAIFQVSPVEGHLVDVEMTAGLMRDRDPEQENYGVYFYCNRRLIVKELRVRDVGYFVAGEAGVPHPDASLCRVIVKLQGAAKLMPWNSSKSGINYSHPAFSQLRPKLIELVTYYSSLSRRLKNSWDEDVFAYNRGRVAVIESEEISLDRKIVLPDLPRVRKPPRADAIKALNKKTLRDKPWTLGLVEAMGLVDVVSRTKLDTKNRAALILLDSNFEIALKEFIVNNRDLYPPHKYNDAKIAELFARRTSVIRAIEPHVNLSKTLLDKVAYYYNLRNKLTHERATVGITDAQIVDYKETVEKVLKTLFGLKFPTD
jgi:histidine kinase/DNA gyrase B/HSP90-like ATPase